MANSSLFHLSIRCRNAFSPNSLGALSQGFFGLRRLACWVLSPLNTLFYEFLFELSRKEKTQLLKGELQNSSKVLFETRCQSVKKGRLVLQL